ncbi:uncharacterized protein [Apostichopus japonicus]|uniref:uncharacterized protein isoform X2 n=1 Tax=Stichopus japonicus TaxID=307972 RepID=UPI003AB895E0
MAGNDVQDQENTALASESLLQDLAGKLVGWKFLGRQLGLTEANLDDIEQDNRESKEKKYQTLLQWKRTSAQRPTIGCLANALKKVGRADLAVFVMQDGPVETSEDCYEIVQARAPSREGVLLTCVCGINSYKELKSHSDESSVVSLVCNSCAAEWFPTTESAKLHLVWDNKKFSYKIPRSLVLSKLRHDKVTDVNKLQRGDHIVFRRSLIYDHHAIFLHISENEKEKIKVIHRTGVPVLIKCEDIMFPRGGVRRVQYPECDPTDVVVARAYDMLYNSSQEFDLINNNCETLATFCKIGKAFSIQGEVVGDVLPFVPKFLTLFQN